MQGLRAKSKTVRKLYGTSAETAVAAVSPSRIFSNLRRMSSAGEIESLPLRQFIPELRPPAPAVCASCRAGYRASAFDPLAFTW